MGTAPSTLARSVLRPRAGVIVAALLVLAALPSVSHAELGDVCADVQNPIKCENTKPGADPATWEIDGAGDPSIQGFATQMSVNKGNAIAFKIKSATSNYRIDILRLGYYGGKGARLIASNLSPTGTSTQPACQTFSDTGLIDCGNWAVSATWNVPSSAVSGVYIAHLVRNDTGGESHIVFVVRDDASTSPVVFQTSDTTWQAYNTYGGNSTYTCSVACPPGEPSTYKGAYKVSYNRPFNGAEDDGGRSWLLTGGEYPMIRFLEAAGYNVSYLSGVDVHRRGELIRNHKLFLSVGHDEYWSQTQRNSMEAARDAGVNLAFFSGNTGFWKTRWEPSAAGPVTQDRTLVTYKDTHFPAQQDPVEWTGTWRDPRFTEPPNRPIPENALLGLSFLVNTGTSAITVQHEHRKLRMWRNTAVANLASGQSLTLAPSTLGYEWDVDADNGFRPAGLFRLSSTTVSGLEVFTDYGSNVTRDQTATHNMVAYRAPSGALVFNAGTVQWSWGLDDYNQYTTINNTMRQATVNLFADMGTQPSNVLPGIVAATQSTDTTKPTSTITNPPASVSDGAKVTITGTASDMGGVVGGVEVSTDGGDTWHPATSGTTSWTYTWIAHGNPVAKIRSRATDDSGNTEVPSAGANVTVNCPCSLWGPNVAPPIADVGDPNGAELGVKFTSETYGTITGIRFFKSALNTGTHIGSLWTTSGTRLAQVTFAGESASGWQTATFSSPVSVMPNTTYIASYHAPNGHFAATPEHFYPNPAPGPNGGAMNDAPPLHAVRNTTTTTNGLYAYSPTTRFPTNSYNASNYWVDVLFIPTPPPGEVRNVSATAGGKTSANVSWDAPATGGGPRSYTITPRINGVAQTPMTITGDPPLTTTTISGLTNGTTYTFTVKASNPAGSGPESEPSNAVTPQTAVAPAKVTGVDARPGTQRALVSWSTPSSDGDSPITSYKITPYVGAAAQAPTTVGGSATSATVTGLTNGTGYKFTVTATNDIGDGPESDASGAVTPQSTIFDFATPATIDSQDTNAVELGVKFTVEYSGSVTGLRFYRSAANTGPHTVNLWTATGTRLAQATLTEPAAAGWQTVTFASPIAVSAGETYIASYHAPDGHYSAAGGAFTNDVVNRPLTALANSTSPNGVYRYGSTSTFPANSYNSSNYFVDVMFAMPPPGQPVNVTAVEAGRTSATVSWAAPTSGGPVTSYIITPRIGGVAQPSTTVGGSAGSATIGGLTKGTTYTFTVTAANANGKGTESAASNAVTPLTAVAPVAPSNVVARPATSSARVTWDVPTGDGDSPITSYKITPYVGSTAQTSTTVGASAQSTTIGGLANGTAYTFRVTAYNEIGASPQSAPSNPVTPRHTIFDFATPSNPDSGDANAVELGVKFRATDDGVITGVRFYKSMLNTGTHTASLWTTSGTRLAQATFTNETASGWQTAMFASPVTISAGETYVASYHAPRGHYAATGGGLSSSVTNGPLTALAASTSPNGVYAYGPSGFPANSYNEANYWVDPMYAGAPAPSAPTGVTATPGSASATVSWTAPASGGAPTSYTVTPRIDGDAQTPKTITGSPPATSTTIGGLTPGTAYTFTVTAANASGSSIDSAPSNSVTAGAATVPGAPKGVSAMADTESAIVRWTAPADDGGSQINGYEITPHNGSTALAPTLVDASATTARVTGLANGTSHTFTVKATNSVGGGAPSAASNAVVPKHSIFEFAEPATVDSGDAAAVTLGVKFTSDVAGTVAGIRFYKSALNTGTHVGSLWTQDGTLLAQATFSGESATGWQSVLFSQPVAITAGTTYVAGYHAPNGHYSVTPAQLATGGADNPPLHVPSNALTPNGLYSYGASTTFPQSSFNGSNYWVDVLFDASA